MAKERWASRLGLVLAMAGNAVGLGNFLRFPAQAAKNGGGSFMIPYLVALLVMGLPLIWVEWTMGRHGGRFGHHSSPGVFDALGGKQRLWKYIGVFGLWVNLIIASYYLYIESWTIAYAFESLTGGFAGATKESINQFFEHIVGHQEGSVVAVSGYGLTFFFICICINVFILSRGLAKGIEIVSKIGMPLLIVFGLVLAIRGMFIVPGSGPNAVESALADPHAIESPFVGFNFIWTPNFDSIWNPSVWLAAAGQIFFTLSIGMGSIHCYASYLRDIDDITLTGATAAWTNEFCEVVIGGSILLPIAVAYMGFQGVQETVLNSSGLDLGFKVFPALFQNWGALAPAAGFIWFGLLFFAAVTSSLAMGQPIMAFLQSEFGFNRRTSALVFGMMLLPLAGAVACTNLGTFFDEFDYWAGTFALVVFAFFETVLFAWVFGMEKGWAEMNLGGELRVPRVFYYVIKYITPVFLFVILISSIFEPKAGWGAYATAISSGSEMPAWEWSGGGAIGKLLHNDLPNDPAASPETTSHLNQIRNVRTIDRCVLVLVFVGFSLLVALAWRRRDKRKEARS